jgi:hypothetical protein
MNLSHVTQATIDKYGHPTVKKISLPGMELGIVKFPLTQSRALMAKEFGLAQALHSTVAQEMAESLLKQYKTPADVPMSEWEKVGIADNLPDHEPVPPGIARNIELNKEAADFDNLVWDQTTVNIVATSLKRVHDTNVLARQPNAYTLFVGPPGTSKSKGSRIHAAILDQPVFTLNAEQVSPENLQAKIVGETVVVGNPSVLAKDLAYKGALSTPHARREVIALLSQKRFEAITPKEWSKVADHEGIEKSTLFPVPGLATLAKRYGGLFNIEELNCLRGDGFTLLTVNVLDVYDQDHPNFYVMSNMNPSNEKHHNRLPLPVEISDRYGQPLPVNALTQKELEGVLRCNFTGMQPTVNINGINTKITPKTFGVAVSNSPSLKVLSSVLQPSSLDTLVERVTKFHKSMEDAISNGSLDKSVSAVPRVQDFSILTRRGLSLFVQGMVSNILSAQYKNVQTTSLSAPVPQTLDLITPKDVVNGITSALQTYYIEPYSFEADKGRMLLALNGKVTGTVTPDATENTSSLITAFIKRCELAPDQLTPVIQTLSGLTTTKAALAAKLTDTANIPAPLAKAVVDTPELSPLIEQAAKDPNLLKDLLTLSPDNVGMLPENKGNLYIMKPVIYNAQETKKNLQYILPISTGSGLSSIHTQAMEQFLKGPGFPTGFVRTGISKMRKAQDVFSSLAPAIQRAQGSTAGITFFLMSADMQLKGGNTDRGLAFITLSKDLVDKHKELAPITNAYPGSEKFVALRECMAFDASGSTPGTVLCDMPEFKNVNTGQLEYSAIDLSMQEITKTRLLALTNKLSKEDQKLVFKARPDLKDSPQPTL